MKNEVILKPNVADNTCNTCHKFFSPEITMISQTFDM